MNADSLTQILQQGFRLTLGATSSLVEMFQDPQKRSENLEKLQTQWHQLAEEWAEKGEQTEQEARKFVDTLLAQQPYSGDSTSETSSTSSTSSAIPTTATTVTQPDSVQDIQELTTQISTLREELERLQDSDSSSS